MEGQQPPNPQPVYQVAGEGKEEFTRLEIRDRIRGGEILPNTEIALKGSESYRAASSFPELSRYFSLAGPAVAIAPGIPAYQGRAQPREMAAPPAAVPSVASHLAQASPYPFTGMGWIVVILVALANFNQFLNLVVSVFASVYMLAVVRKSAEGSMVMPSFADLTGPLTFFVDLLKVIVTTIINAWPVILAAVAAVFMRGMAPVLMFVAVLLMLIYYPASFAILAVTRSILQAITPSRVFGFIGVLGADYAIGLLILIIGFTLSVGAGYVVGQILKPAGLLVTGLISAWLTFYVDHLFGWAIYRHRHELMM